MVASERVVFISGGNRGIGHGLALDMVGKGYRVVAGYRDPDRSRQLLDEARRIHGLFPFKVDVTDESDLGRLKEFISHQFGALDILVNSAGVNPGKSDVLNEMDWSSFAESFRVNVGGSFLTTRHLYPLLQAGTLKKIINISSIMASVQLSGGDATPYRVSKAGLNMLTKNQSIAYRKDGITVVCLHPGWVRTDMGGPAAPLNVEESVSKLIPIIEGLSLANTGEYISIDGSLIPY